MALGILTAISIFLVLNPEQAKLIQFWDYDVLKSLAPAIWTCFVVCILGNLLPIPTPYSFVVWFAGFQLRDQNLLFPAIVAFFASIGCLVGEMVGYFVGRGTAELTEKEYKTIEELKQTLQEHPRLAPFLIFLFGLTPLNDDLLTVPLGFIKYSFKRTLFYCWLGKLCMVLILAYLPFEIGTGGDSLALSIANLYAVVVLIWLMCRFDWFEIVKKMRKGRKKNSAASNP
ncbi:MAG: VTT domain-containing protein [Promethearchaeota archaeon]